MTLARVTEGMFHLANAHRGDVRYRSSELELNGLRDSRWPGDPACVAASAYLFGGFVAPVGGR